MGRLEDIEEIRQLKARYFRFLDTKQWIEMRGILTDDFRMQVEPDVGAELVTLDGADNFVAHLEEVLGDVVSTHHGHTSEIEVTSETTATGIWAMFDDLYFPNGFPRGDSTPMRMRGSGHYHERYLRGEDGRWRIDGYVLTRLRVEWAPIDSTRSEVVREGTTT
jgi:hypothetical protein